MAVDRRASRASADRPAAASTEPRQPTSRGRARRAEPAAPSPSPRPAAPIEPEPPRRIAAAGRHRRPRPSRSPPVESTPAVESAPAAPSAESDDAARRSCSRPGRSVVEQISRNPANRPLINACRPVEVRGATIVLGFPESQAFLRDIAERKRAMLEEGIGRVLGRAVAVKCVATNIELVEPVAALAAASNGEDLVAQARRIFADDLVDVAEVD